MLIEIEKRNNDEIRKLVAKEVQKYFFYWLFDSIFFFFFS
jgi:hypothetical protein